MLVNKLEELRNITQPSKDIDIKNEVKSYIINKYENFKVNKFNFYDIENDFGMKRKYKNIPSIHYKDIRDQFLSPPKLSKFEESIIKEAKTETIPLYKIYKSMDINPKGKDELDLTKIRIQEKNIENSEEETIKNLEKWEQKTKIAKRQILKGDLTKLKISKSQRKSQYSKSLHFPILGQAIEAEAIDTIEKFHQRDILQKKNEVFTQENEFSKQISSLEKSMSILGNKSVLLRAENSQINKQILNIRAKLDPMLGKKLTVEDAVKGPSIFKVFTISKVPSIKFPFFYERNINFYGIKPNETKDKRRTSLFIKTGSKDREELDNYFLGVVHNKSPIISPRFSPLIETRKVKDSRKTDPSIEDISKMLKKFLFLSDIYQRNTEQVEKYEKESHSIKAKIKNTQKEKYHFYLSLLRIGLESKYNFH